MPLRLSPSVHCSASAAVVIVSWARPLCVLALLLGTNFVVLVVVSWARPLCILALLLGTDFVVLVVVSCSSFSFSWIRTLLRSPIQEFP